jgi:thioredoxin reductase
MSDRSREESLSKVIVGMGTCGLSAGAQAAYDRLSEILAKHPKTFELGRSTVR